MAVELLVACARLKRFGIGIEINPSIAKIAKENLSVRSLDSDDGKGMTAYEFSEHRNVASLTKVKGLEVLKQDIELRAEETLETLVDALNTQLQQTLKVRLTVI